jgi:hypothetical protein
VGPVAAASFRPPIPPPPPCFDYRAAVSADTRAAAAVAADPALAGLVESGALVRVPRRRFGPVPAWRPPDFQEPEEVWVLGTSHLSPDSVRDVERVLRAVRPDNVVVELCRSRQGRTVLSFPFVYFFYPTLTSWLDQACPSLLLLRSRLPSYQSDDAIAVQSWTYVLRPQRRRFRRAAPQVQHVFSKRRQVLRCCQPKHQPGYAINSILPRILASVANSAGFFAMVQEGRVPWLCVCSLPFSLPRFPLLQTAPLERRCLLVTGTTTCTLSPHHMVCDR